MPSIVPIVMIVGALIAIAVVRWVYVMDKRHAERMRFTPTHWQRYEWNRERQRMNPGLCKRQRIYLGALKR